MFSCEEIKEVLNSDLVEPVERYEFYGTDAEYYLMLAYGIELEDYDE